MIKIIRTLLAVAITTVVMFVFIVTLILNVPFHLYSSVESERFEADGAEHPPINFGLSSNIYPFHTGLAWLPDGMVRIIPPLGVNIGLLRPYYSATSFARSFMVGTSTTLSDEELGYSTKHRLSYETGIRIHLSPTIGLNFTHGKRYEGDNVTTSFTTGFGL